MVPLKDVVAPPGRVVTGACIHVAGASRRLESASGRVEDSERGLCATGACHDGHIGLPLATDTMLGTLRGPSWHRPGVLPESAPSWHFRVNIVGSLHRVVSAPTGSLRPHHSPLSPAIPGLRNRPEGPGRHD
jgi:hypothetical protein